MAVETLESYLGGRWSRGQGIETELIDPTTGDVLATASAKGLDFAGALAYARQHGGPALRALSYAERAKLLSAVADVLVANRARYEEIAIANSGNTKIDAAIDIDGGIGTLKYYARLGAGLGEAKALLDENPVRLAKAENFQAIHMQVPRHGVAVHINAFNFPSWGLWEKAACALLSGMPMLAKPASATCWLSHQMVRDVIAAKVLPEGALSLLCGGIGDLLDHVTADDVIAFTGSSGTAQRIVAHPNVLHRGTRVNMEADSVNAALLAPGVAAATPVFDCLRQGSGEGDDAEGRAEMHRHPPRLRARRSRPMPSPRRWPRAWPRSRSAIRATRRPAWARWSRARSRTPPSTASAGSAAKPISSPAASIRLCSTASTRRSPHSSRRRCSRSRTARATRCTTPRCSGPARRSLLTRMRPKPSHWWRAAAVRWSRRSMARIAISWRARRSSWAPRNGRILAIEPSIADAHTGHGIVMPQCHHGGPGRAGNGAELGGLYGLRFYQQRVAVQGSTDLLTALQAQDGAGAH